MSIYVDKPTQNCQYGCEGHKRAIALVYFSHRIPRVNTGKTVTFLLFGKRTFLKKKTFVDAK
jgi:hypothetical protein